MKRIIVTGHGGYASGMKGAYNMLAGEKENVVFIDYLANETEEDLLEKFKPYLNDEVLFMCDLVGGTPFKVAAREAMVNNNIQIVTGSNVGALIDCAMKIDKMDIVELAKLAKERSLIHMTLFEVPKEENSKGEGI